MYEEFHDQCRNHYNLHLWPWQDEREAYPFRAEFDLSSFCQGIKGSTIVAYAYWPESINHSVSTPDYSTAGHIYQQTWFSVNESTAELEEIPRKTISVTDINGRLKWIQSPYLSESDEVIIAAWGG